MNRVVWIIGFLALTFAGDRLGGYALKKITDRSQFRYSRLYNDTTYADVLLVGNSRGLMFYQPEIEKLADARTFNLSYNGMPADLAKTLVMDYLDRRAAPRLMVMDVTMCDRVNDALIAGFAPYAPYSERIAALIKHYDQVDSLGGSHNATATQISHLYRYNNELFQRTLYYRNKLDKDWLLDRTITEKMATDTALASYKIAMFPGMVQELKDAVDYARKKGVAVKLVVNPYFPPFQAAIRDSFLAPLIAAVEQATGLPVNDYSTALQETAMFGDYQHANKTGSIAYMNILAKDGMFKRMDGGPVAESILNNMIQNVPPASVQYMETGYVDTLLKTPTMEVILAKPVPQIAAKKTKSVRRWDDNKNWIGVDTFSFRK